MRYALAAALLLIAGVHSTWAASWQIGGVAPDLFLIVAISLGINLGWADGALLGMALGFVQATLHGADFGSYLVSRCLAGALAGYLQPAISRDNLFAPSLCVLGVSFAAETMFFLMAPRPFADWLVATVTLCAYNAVIASTLYIPLTAIIRRMQPGA